MAFENFPKDESRLSDPKDTTTVVKKNNNTRAILTAVLVVALLGTWGYIIFDKNKTE